MENKESPWYQSPEETEAAEAVRAELKAAEVAQTALESTLRDIQSQLEDFIAEKQLVVNTQAVEGTFAIRTAENNTFDRLDDKIEELLGFANNMLSGQGVSGHLVVDRYADQHLLRIRLVS